MKREIGRMRVITTPSIPKIIGFRRSSNQIFANTKILYYNGDGTKRNQSLFKPRRPLVLAALS